MPIPPATHSLGSQRSQQASADTFKDSPVQGLLANSEVACPERKPTAWAGRICRPRCPHSIPAARPGLHAAGYSASPLKGHKLCWNIGPSGPFPPGSPPPCCLLETPLECAPSTPLPKVCLERIDSIPPQTLPPLARHRPLALKQLLLSDVGKEGETQAV